MDITRRSDYACRILRAAYKADGDYISVADIADQESIPYAFARSIQHDLVKNNLIKTNRGAHGGIILDCDPTEVTLLEILEAVQGPMTISSCINDPEFCDKSNECAYNQVWRGVDKLIQDYLSEITLSDLFTLGGDHPVIRKAMCENASVTDDSSAAPESEQESDPDKKSKKVVPKVAV